MTFGPVEVEEKIVIPFEIPVVVEEAAVNLDSFSRVSNVPFAPPSKTAAVPVGSTLPSPLVKERRNMFTMNSFPAPFVSHVMSIWFAELTYVSLASMPRLVRGAGAYLRIKSQTFTTSPAGTLAEAVPKN
jgi:hypothetical protein